MPARLLLAIPLAVATALAQVSYQKPPKEVQDVLSAPTPPQLMLSPTRDTGMLVELRRYPPIAEVAQPMLRLAGLRINPNTSGPHNPLSAVSISLLRFADGSQSRIALPADAKLSVPDWSPDGKNFAFANTTARGIELWVGETATANARRMAGLTLNGAYGDPVSWMPDNRTLLVKLVPAGRGKAPAQEVPTGPNVQETSGRGTGVWTMQDLLKSPHDEALFDHYATSQLALVDGAKVTSLGAPAIFQGVQPSPDGKYLLVTRVHKPYSYLHASFSFPKEVEIWDRAGKTLHKLASQPLADSVPVDGVVTGPRGHQWRSTEPATVVWTEALDGGDPKKKVGHRDRVLVLKAPFTGPPSELIRTEHRFSGMQWIEKGGLALAHEFERDRRWQRATLLDADDPGKPRRQVWSLDMRDRYKDPGNPISRTLPSGHRAIQRNGDWIYFSGQGATPEGDRPFLDRFSLETFQTERLFRSDAKSYEAVAALLDEAGTRFLTRRETPSDPPNYYIRTVSGQGTMKALTQFSDPTPQLRGIKKQLVTYKRGDGVQLSFTLYLPPGYKEGTRLPAFVWAYPLEYNDPGTAGQVVGSTQRFTSIGGASHLFFLLRGYAVLDNTTMPVVGDFQTVNNTYVEQVVASAKAAIDKAVEMGVVDADRIAVGGHSYGGFMTANLLAHSDLFRTGIARSGAYNRTLTPFGFQSERRTLWEAPELYVRMSPYMHANKINEPILMIHGEADNNAGTHPIQSERLYQAIRGHQGTARLVMLPHESHGYIARESIEHTLYEMIQWLDKHVKNAPPRPRQATSGQ